MMRPRKIACLFPSIERGGSEQVLFNLTRGLQAQGHKVYFFSLKSPIIELAKDLPPVQVVHQPFAKLFKFLALWRLGRVIRKEERRQGEFDLILSNVNSRRLLKTSHRERLFYFLHMDAWASMQCQYADNPRRLRAERQRLRAYYRSKQVIAVSEGAAHSLINHIGASLTLPSWCCWSPRPILSVN